MTLCPRCASPEPHLHPTITGDDGEAVQLLCPHKFHLRVTERNTLENIALTQKRIG